MHRRFFQHAEHALDDIGMAGMVTIRQQVATDHSRDRVAVRRSRGMSRRMREQSTNSREPDRRRREKEKENQ